MLFIIRKLVVSLIFIYPMNILLADNLKPDKVCTASLTNEDLVGIYSITIGPGLVSMGGMSMPYPESPKIPAKIFLLNNDLMISSDDDRLNMTFKKVEGNKAPWHISSSKVLKMADNDDISLVLGCKTTDLPHYIGKGWFLSADNVKVPSSMKLIVYGISDAGIDASGIMNSSAQGVTFKVRVALEGGDLIGSKARINKNPKTNIKKETKRNNDHLNEMLYQEEIQNQRDYIDNSNRYLFDRMAQEEARQKSDEIKKMNDRLSEEAYRQEVQKKIDEINKANSNLLGRLAQGEARQKSEEIKKMNDLYIKQYQKYKTNKIE